MMPLGAPDGLDALVVYECYRLISTVAKLFELL